MEVLEKVIKRYERAKARRSLWEGHWQECYDYVLPQREGSLNGETVNGEKKGTNLYDGTAPDAAEQLAASLMAELTPPWSKWFGLTAGVDLSDEEKDNASPILDEASDAILSNLHRSNFAVEMHQCYLDLITAGTASLMFEEAEIGMNSSFKFTAIPICDLVIDESSNGNIDITFRKSKVSLEALVHRFPQAELPDNLMEKLEKEPDIKVAIVEAVLPKDGGSKGYDYYAFLDKADSEINISNDKILLKKGVFERSPFINFRWLKAPGEIYGRSPVMKALPDIKTANKVVELILKNASIAVTGIWQADDDGVLNPANIKLIPGTIIPKAVGSKGLSPLEAPGKFDVSQLVLDDLRARIKHALLADRLGQIDAPSMSATEVLERSAEMARILGATYGRLQSELLTPLIMRATSILKRRGEIPSFAIDGHMVEIQYKSPLAKLQAQAEATNIMSWFNSLNSISPEAISFINVKAAVDWISKTLSIPSELITKQAALVNQSALMGGELPQTSELINAQEGREVAPYMPQNQEGLTDE